MSYVFCAHLIQGGAHEDRPTKSCPDFDDGRSGSIAKLHRAQSCYHIPYTPTYASSLNQVELWFLRISQLAIRRDSFGSVKELIAKIDHFVQTYNAKARPFSWTATADSMLAKVQRLCEHISGTQH